MWVNASFMIFITWNLSKVMDALGNLSWIPDMNAVDISQQKLSIFLLDPLCSSKMFADHISDRLDSHMLSH